MGRKKKRSSYAYNGKQGHCFQLHATLPPFPLPKQTTLPPPKKKKTQIFKEHANIAHFTKLYMTLHPRNIIVSAEKMSPLKGQREREVRNTLSHSITFHPSVTRGLHGKALWGFTWAADSKFVSGGGREKNRRNRTHTDTEGGNESGPMKQGSWDHDVPAPLQLSPSSAAGARPAQADSRPPPPRPRGSPSPGRRCDSWRAGTPAEGSRGEVPGGGVSPEGMSPATRRGRPRGELPPRREQPGTHLGAGSLGGRRPHPRVSAPPPARAAAGEKSGEKGEGREGEREGGR